MNDIKAVHWFLKNSVPINQAVNSDSPIAPGYTPLHFAARFFGVETLELLIEKGADISLTDAKKMSPLHLVIKRNIEIIDYVSDYEEFKENFETNKNMIKLLIGKNLPTGIKIIDDTGLSYFHVSCMLRDVVLVSELFQNVLDINHSVNEDSPFWAGYSALHFAAHFDLKIVNFLVNEGANILLKDCQGVTPLDVLLLKYDVQDFNLIIESQPQWKNILFSDNKTKLIDLISSMQTVDKFESFLSKVPDVNMFVPLDSSLWPGYTPLHLAVIFCNNYNFKNCFTFYVDINRIIERKDDELRDKSQDSLNKIQVCLKLYTDVTAQDLYGSTAVHVAFYKKRMDIVDQLLKKQSEICQPVDHKGLSHLHMAFAVSKKVARAKNAASEYDKCIALLTNQAEISIALKSKLVTVHKDPSDSYPKIISANAGSTPLHISVQSGNITLTEKLLARGFDRNDKDVNGFTPIHQLLATRTAFEYTDDGKALHELLFSSNLVDCVSNCGLNYLHVACYVKNQTAVKKLLDSGADVNAIIVPSSSMDDDNDFPERQLLLANQRITNHLPYCRINSLDCIKLYTNYTPLHFAVCKFGYKIDYEIVDLLLQFGANMLAKKMDGSVLLYEILAETQEYTVEDTQLTQLFINELERNDQWQKIVEEDSGITMLHLACKLLDLDAIERLLKSGYNANARCFSNSPLWPGSTPLHILATSSDRQRQDFDFGTEDLEDKVCAIAKILLEHGAEIAIQNTYHKTPLHQSIPEITNLRYTDLNLYLTKILLKYHKDFSNNPIDDRGISHFHIACVCNDVTLVKSFLQHGVDVNQATDFYVDNCGGYTPLHFAIKYKFEDIRLLLQYNANVNATSCLMETPLHLVRLPSETQQLKTEYLEILLNAGAKVNEQTIWGETPLKKIWEHINEETCYFIEEEEEEEFINEEIVNTIIKYKFGLNVFIHENESIENGFIGSILCNKKTYEKPLQNPVFQAALKDPDLIAPDFLGRSVIHNVVRTGLSGEKPSTDEYIKIIEELIKLGFDIDHRDKRGFTPLHAATGDENVSVIESLLMHGADVNIRSARVNVAFTFCVTHYDDDEQAVNWPVYRTFRRHFNKLSRFNLFVHSSNQRAITQMPTDYYFDEGEHEAQVIDEGNRLKLAKIEPYSIILNDFLCETGVVAGFPFMLQPKREAISKFFREKGEYFRKNFPELAGILYYQYRKALERQALIHPAFIAFNVLIDFELPILCSENIFEFLTNTELKKLIATEKLCDPTSSS